MNLIVTLKYKKKLNKKHINILKYLEVVTYYVIINIKYLTFNCLQRIIITTTVYENTR